MVKMRAAVIATIMMLTPAASFAALVPGGHTSEIVATRSGERAEAVRVERGDTFSRFCFRAIICRLVYGRHDRKVWEKFLAEIKRLNPGIKDLNKIYPGQMIRLPLSQGVAEKLKADGDTIRRQVSGLAWRSNIIVQRQETIVAQRSTIKQLMDEVAKFEAQILDLRGLVSLKDGLIANLQWTIGNLTGDRIELQGQVKYRDIFIAGLQKMMGGVFNENLELRKKNASLQATNERLEAEGATIARQTAARLEFERRIEETLVAITLATGFIWFFVFWASRQRSTDLATVIGSIKGTHYE